MISAGRILLVAPLVWLIVIDSRTASYVAAALFVAGALTDGLDGYLARRWDTSTRTGQWLDPLADKAFVAAPLIALSAQGRFPAWAAVLILVREVGISLLRAFLGTRGRSMPASWPAKAKTTVQMAAITLYVLPLARSWNTAKLTVLVAAVALTLATGARYVVAAAGRAPGAAPPEGGGSAG